MTRPPTEAALVVPFGLICQPAPTLGNVQKHFFGDLVAGGLSHSVRFSGLSAEVFWLEDITQLKRPTFATAAQWMLSRGSTYIHTVRSSAVPTRLGEWSDIRFPGHISHNAAALLDLSA
jgi:hypothetical protein